MRRSSVVFRVAEQPWEIEQVHRLNRATFAEEIPQHRADGDLLVDRFHDQNTYVVAVDGDRVVGMLAVRDRRPFSLDDKLPDLDAYLPPGRHVCEVRLLAIAKERRGQLLLPGLMRALWDLGSKRGYEVAVLSAFVRRVELYARLGCVPFGPRVGAGDLCVQPMLATRDGLFKALGELDRGTRRRASPARGALSEHNFLPGPVVPRDATREAFARPAISHRSAEFRQSLGAVKRRLLDLSGGSRVEVLVGSGTLANDVVAAQLALLDGDGLVLANGEFGQRLEDHARRHGLRFSVLAAPWGEPFALAKVEQALASSPPPAWLWCVHCETSTGVLNDLAALQRLCATRGVRLCADCISSLGTVELDLSRVYLASGASGKALRGYPGLALVFSDHAVEPRPDRLPRYLDLGLWSQSDGVPFTHSSNLVSALGAALEAASERTFRELADAAAWLRARLRTRGYRLVAPEACAAPAILSIALPAELDARQVGDQLRDRGFLVSYESGYLLQRNWIQICLMSTIERPALESLLAALPPPSPALSPSPPATAARGAARLEGL